MTIRRLLLSATLVAAVAVPIAAAPPVGAAAKDCARTPRVLRDVRYDSLDGVAPNLLALDLFLPTTGRDCPAAPIVVGVHGGGWQRGDKRGFTGDKAALFNGKGWAFASVNYRLSGPDVTPPVQYPTHDQDVAHAVAFLVDHAGRYGIDPEQVGMLGHSAGAGVVAAIATDEQFLEDAGLGLDTLQCVFPDDISFDVARAIASGGHYAAISRQAFGDDPAVWADASPINHVEAGKGIPPTLLVRRGGPVWQAEMERFADALRDAGIDVTIIDASGYTHGEVNSLIGSTTDPVMTEPVTTFFEDCFRS